MIWAYLIHLGVNMWRKPQSDRFAIDSYFKELPTEDKAWREITDFIAEKGFNTLIIDLGEGVRYESHPKLATKGAWSKEKLKTELQRLKSIGLTPIPKLNFATIHDCWMGEYGSMPSTPTYYKVVADLIDEVIELFDTPKYFHLGMDEEPCDPNENLDFIQMQDKYGITLCRPNKLYFEDINFMADCCLKKGVRPWIWGDCARALPEETIKYLSRDILVSPCYYRSWRQHELLNYPFFTTAYNAHFIFAENGFEQVPTSATYITSVSPDDMMFFMKDQPGVKGYMTAPWYRTREIDILKHKAEAKVFSIAKNKYYKEDFK